MERTQKLTKAIVSALIEEEVVNVEVEQKDYAVYLTVFVPEEKIARVIGKEGKVAESIRTIVRGLKETKSKIFVRFNSI